MHQLFMQLCRTGDIRTAEHTFSLVSDCLCTADRTAFRQNIRHSIFLMRNASQDFRNNIPCFPDDNLITDTDIFFCNKILIMQDCSGNACSGERNRIEYGNRSQSTCPADIDFNFSQSGFFFFRREFIGNCPFRRFGSRAE